MPQIDRNPPSAAPDMPQQWVLYLLECAIGRGAAAGAGRARRTTMYAGITNDLQARFAAHQAGTGAKYTRANPPLRILGARAFPDRASASRAEWALKQVARQRKLATLNAVGAALENAHGAC